MSSWNVIKPSEASMRPKNLIRDTVDRLKVPPNPSKPLIALSIGDPTVFGNLANADNINDALCANIKSRKFNGYAHSCGFESTRAAVARKYSLPNSPLTAEDVIITSGCSHAIELSMGVLCNPGQSILLPAPGFSTYQTICEYKGIVPKFYKLKPSKGWEADIDHLESLIDDTTAAILVNNPSNPCGSVYSKEHLQELLAVAEKHHLPIIADEIYDEIVFEGHTFYPMASLTNTVPILATGGLAKVHLVPGWRLGWIVIHDRNNLFQQVRVGLTKLTQIIVGANTLVQSVVEEALLKTPPEYLQNLNGALQANAKLLVDRLGKIEGLRVVEPGGAMYMMLGFEPQKFRDLPDDVEFARLLLQEELVFVLPGRIFKCDNFMRLVICPPLDKLGDACDRIEAFCKRHYL